MAMLRIEGLELDVPEDALAGAGSPEQVAVWARQALVLQLLREAQISQGWAARLLGITRWDIFDLMAKYEIPSGPRRRRRCSRISRTPAALSQNRGLSLNDLAYSLTDLGQDKE